MEYLVYFVYFFLKLYVTPCIELNKILTEAPPDSSTLPSSRIEIFCVIDSAAQRDREASFAFSPTEKGTCLQKMGPVFQVFKVMWLYREFPC